MIKPVDRIERRAAAGTIAGVVSLGVTLLQAIVQVPLLLSFWSVETFGLWIALAAAANLLTAPDLGHQNFLGNEFNRLWVEDRRALQRTLASGLRGATVIVLAELLGFGALWAGGRMDWLVPGDAVSLGSADFAASLAAYLAFWAINGSAGGILVRLYVPAGMYARAQWFGVAYRLAGMLAVLSAAAGGASLFGTMLAQLAAYSVCNVVLFLDLRRQVPAEFPWWRGGDWRTGWTNLRASFVLTLNGIVDQLGGNGLVLVLGRVLSPVAVSVFTTLRTVANIATQGSAVLLQPLAPDLVRFFVRREPAKLEAVFGVSWFVGNTAVCAGFLLALPWVEPLYGLWTRGRLPFEAGIFAALAGAVAVRQWAAPSTSLLAGLNLLRAQSVLVGLRTLVTLGVAWLCLVRFGAVAAGLAVLAGEISGAALAQGFAAGQLRGIGGRLATRAIVLSLLQLGCLGAGAGLFLAVPGAPVRWVLALLAGVVILLGWWQWRDLPSEVHERLRTLLRRTAGSVAGRASRSAAN